MGLPFVNHIYQNFNTHFSSVKLALCMKLGIVFNISSKWIISCNGKILQKCLLCIAQSQA
jgi:hypothetical protein